jgi:hypothetical protein
VGEGSDGERGSKAARVPLRLRRVIATDDCDD